MSKLISLFLLMFVMVAPTISQADNASPLLNMLALVPDNEDSRKAIVSYADYRALEAARGIDTPSDAGILLSGPWIAALGGVSSGMQLSYIMARLEEMPEAVGFSFLDIDRSLVFGNPPGMGTILSGSFDPERIGAAYRESGYEVDNFDGLTVFCGPDGCDSGLKMDLKNVNPANPFGGNLGRQEPLAILPEFLANSPDLNVLQRILDARKGIQESLADAPDYRAVTLAAADQGSINQIQFVNPLDLVAFDPSALMLDEDAMNQLMESSASFDTLPAYSLAAFADVWDGSQQRALILLAYDDESNAQAAAEELAQRMGTFVPFSTGVPFAKRLEDLGGIVDAPAVYTDLETGTSVAVWSMRYPMPSNEQDGEAPLTISSLGFRFIIDALYRRDLYVLALEPVLSK